MGGFPEERQKREVRDMHKAGKKFIKAVLFLPVAIPAFFCPYNRFPLFFGFVGLLGGYPSVAWWGFGIAAYAFLAAVFAPMIYGVSVRDFMPSPSACVSDDDDYVSPNSILSKDVVNSPTYSGMEGNIYHRD